MISEQHEELHARLIDADILEEDGELLGLSPSFEEERRHQREQIDNLPAAERQAEFQSVLGDSDSWIQDINQDLACDAIALREFLPDLDSDDAIEIAFAMRRFDNPPRSSRAPDGFTPIRGREIPAFLGRNPVSVLYFWRDDCEPCEALRTELEAIVENGILDDRVGLGAIYGPDSLEFIYDEYEVGVAPTVLFCADGRVDSRYIGAKHRATLEAEIKIIQESLPEE